jgi:hypothetical protein
MSQAYHEATEAAKKKQRRKPIRSEIFISTVFSGICFAFGVAFISNGICLYLFSETPNKPELFPLIFGVYFLIAVFFLLTKYSDAHPANYSARKSKIRASLISSGIDSEKKIEKLKTEIRNDIQEFDSEIHQKIRVLAKISFGIPFGFVIVHLLRESIAEIANHNNLLSIIDKLVPIYLITFGLIMIVLNPIIFFYQYIRRERFYILDCLQDMLYSIETKDEDLIPEIKIPDPEDITLEIENPNQKDIILKIKTSTPDDITLKIETFVPETKK